MYTKETFKQEAKYTIIDFLKDGYEGYLCDMHNEIFNTEHYTEDENKAISILDELGGYSVVAEIIKYQTDNFGEVMGDFSSPVWVLSMYWYIVGETALWELAEGLEEVNALWNEELTETECLMLYLKMKENL